MLFLDKMAYFSSKKRCSDAKLLTLLVFLTIIPTFYDKRKIKSKHIMQELHLLCTEISILMGTNINWFIANIIEISFFYSSKLIKLTNAKLYFKI